MSQRRRGRGLPLLLAMLSLTSPALPAGASADEAANTIDKAAEDPPPEAPEAEAESGRPVVEEQIVVTATRREEELQQVPAAISVVGAEEIARRGTTSRGQELVGVPGVKFDSFNEGTYGSIQIRGTPSENHNDTFVALVDGVPFMTNSDEADLERLLPLAVVERVEVLRGPTSALYGRGGVAGAVNYITRDAFAAPRLDVALDGGSYGYLRPQLGLALAPGERNRLLVHAFYEEKDGWRDGSEREAMSAFVKDDWLPRDDTSLTGYASYYDSSQAFASLVPTTADGTLIPIPGGESANHQIDDPFDERRFSLATLSTAHTPSPRLSLQGTLQARDVDFRTNIGFYGGFDPDAGVLSWIGYAAQSDYSLLYGEPQLTLELDQLRLVAGASYERLTGGSDTFWTGQFGFVPDAGFLFYRQRRDLATGQWLDRDTWVTDQRLDVEYVNEIYGAYAQAEWDLLPVATLTLGARFDSFGRDADFAEIAPRGDVIPATTHSERNERVSPRASLSVRFTPRLTAYAAYGEGFAPAFGLISGFNSRDDGLKPEVSRNYELGVKGTAAGGRLGFGAAVYRLERQDLLVQVFGTGEERIRFTNAGGQHAEGLELESRAALDALVPGLSAYLAYTYTDSVWDDYRFIDDFTGEAFDFSGQEVTGVPPHMITLRLERQVAPSLTLGAWYDYRSDHVLDRRATVEGGAYGLLSASASWALPWLTGCEVGLTGSNLLDESYYRFDSTNHALVGAYPGRPRELLVSLRVRR